MKTWRTIAWIALVALAAAAGWWGRGAHAPAPEEGPCPGGAKPLHWRAPMDPSYVRDAPGKSPMGMDLVPVCPEAPGASAEEGIVRIDPRVVQDIGVRTAVVERATLSRKLRTVGRVTFDERRVAHVHTKVQGWVERLHVEYEGERVRRGQPLLEIYSPDLVSAQEELLQAARYREKTGASTFADVAEGGEALFRAARRRLELWDIPERDVDRLLETGKVRKTLTLYAPTEGVVTELRVREGMEVAPNQNLYTIADLSRVWVFADVYESELPWVSEGQSARVALSYLPGRTFEGTVTYIYPVLDPATRTARVRIELSNEDGVLKPDMYADVTIRTETREDVRVVPDEAVIRSGRRALVIVAHGDGRFEPRPVELGLSSGEGQVQITSGVEVGERVVTSGQFLIDSESRLQEAVEKLAAPAALPDGEGGNAAGTGEAEGHAMPAAPGHEGHAMPMPTAPEREGHAMPGAPGHEGHAMPGAPGHEGHGMPMPAAPSPADAEE